MSGKPTDEQILALVRYRPHVMTYVIRNMLSHTPWGDEPKHPAFKNLDTAFVRRRLLALEKAGEVERVPSSYAVQLCWKATARAPQVPA
jgi:hypothetical protein